MRFFFSCHVLDSNDNPCEVTYSCEGKSWGIILEHFQSFLNGCGFILPQTDIDIREIVEEKHNEKWNKKYG